MSRLQGVQHDDSVAPGQEILSLREAEQPVEIEREPGLRPVDDVPGRGPNPETDRVPGIAEGWLPFTPVEQEKLKDNARDGERHQARFRVRYGIHSWTVWPFREDR